MHRVNHIRFEFLGTENSYILEVEVKITNIIYLLYTYIVAMCTMRKKDRISITKKLAQLGTANGKWCYVRILLAHL